MVDVPEIGGLFFDTSEIKALGKTLDNNVDKTTKVYSDLEKDKGKWSAIAQKKWDTFYKQWLNYVSKWKAYYIKDIVNSWWLDALDAKTIGDWAEARIEYLKVGRQFYSTAAQKVLDAGLKKHAARVAQIKREAALSISAHLGIPWNKLIVAGVVAYVAVKVIK